PGPPLRLRAGARGHHWRVPGQFPAQGGPLAARGPPRTRAGDQRRRGVRAVRRPRRDPAHADVAKLGQALATLAGPYELMASFAAYTGLRWGEIAALTIAQINQVARVVTVDRKVIEVGGKLYIEA